MNERQLIDAAIAAADMAYAPYSNFRVGAALLAADGTLFTGCNVENAAYPATICAERTALVKAISEGRRDFAVIVVANRSGGYPCGTCRQMLYEFSPNMQVIVSNLQGEVVNQCSLTDLLPHGFGPAELDL
jgi:cytidine deaminase